MPRSRNGCKPQRLRSRAGGSVSWSPGSPACWGTIAGDVWTDHEDRLAAEWLQRKSILVDVSIAAQAVQTVSKDHLFHPILETVQWDGVERLEQWLSTYLGVEDTPMQPLWALAG